MTRDEGHDWSKDCEKCGKCNSTRKSVHEWKGSSCTLCGRSRIPLLCNELKYSRDQDRRTEIMNTLAELGDLGAVDALCEVQGDYPNESMKKVAIGVLCQIGMPAINRLCYIAGGSIYSTLATTMVDKYRRDVALDALAIMGNQYVDELCDIMNSNKGFENEGAARALAKMSCPSSIPALLQAIKTNADSRTDVRILAKLALITIENWKAGICSDDIALVESIKQEGYDWE